MGYRFESRTQRSTAKNVPVIITAFWVVCFLYVEIVVLICENSGVRLESHDVMGEGYSILCTSGGETLKKSRVSRPVNKETLPLTCFHDTENRAYQ